MKITKIIISIFLIIGIKTNAKLSYNFYCQVPPKREVRAVWMTTIGGLDWPKTYAHTSWTIEKQKQELRTLLDKLRKANFNTVLLQTRIRGTVIYPSKYEPWDGCISGNPGVSPGYDPLSFAIEECHKRGMECQAWIVCIPVGKPNGAGSKNLKQKHPELLMNIGNEIFMRPEKQGTAEYIASICREISHNYDIDGIHLDYIRYPENMKLPISRAQARKNISNIVKNVHDVVKAEKPWVKISCSPIGKRNDLNRYWSYGWNAEEKGCQDVERWMKEGWMDQIYPMMYFRGNNFYPFAADWQERSHGKTVCAGLGVYFLSTQEGNWNIEEIQREMNVCRQMGLGIAMFRNSFLMNNIKGLYDFVSNEHNRYPALLPEMSWYKHDEPKTPQNLLIKRNEFSTFISWNIDSITCARQNQPIQIYYNVYTSNMYPVDINDPRNLIVAKTCNRSITIPNTERTKYIAVTSIDRYGKESSPLQSCLLEREENIVATQTQLIYNNENTIHIPQFSSTLDIDYILFENCIDCIVASKKYTETINISNIPDGIYKIRSLSRKGKSHRLGWVLIKRIQ